MKATSLSIAIPALCATLLAPAPLFAIEAPEDNAPPPAQALQPDAQPEPKPTAFLGIMTEPIPQALRDHLNLDDPHGVLVTIVVPDGPAHNSGLTTNEVITAIDDKKITSPEEISAIIANHKPGDEIRITTIRKGKPTEHKTTLGERPAHMPMAGPVQRNDIPALENIPDELADRIRRMIEENEQGFNLPMLPFDEAMPAPELEGAMKQMRKQMEEAMKGGMKFELGLDGNGIHAQREATFRMMDNEGSIELKSQDDAKEVTVRDKDNNIIWTGPWDTEQDKAAAPDEIRERIERLNIGEGRGGLRLNLNPK